MSGEHLSGGWGNSKSLINPPTQIAKCLLRGLRHPGGQSGCEFAPHKSGAQMLEQAKREHEIDADARGETPKSSLASPALIQYRIHQLGRDDLR